MITKKWKKKRRDISTTDVCKYKIKLSVTMFEKFQERRGLLTIAIRKLRINQ